MKKVTKAIITAAGYGTRFLPATKNVPKELLPIINRPTIDYVVRDFVKAGIKDIVIVTRFGNHSIEDYFDTNPNLEKYLLEKRKDKELNEIREIYSSANFIFVRQNPDLPYGNASPLYSVKDLIKEGESFFYAWGDDLVLHNGSVASEMLDIYKKVDADIILNCFEVEESLITKLGIVKIKENSQNKVEQIIEKPKLEEAPSNIASGFAFLLNDKIFEYLDPSSITTNEEFLIQTAIDKLCKKGKVYASLTKGKWLTMGDPLNFLKATVEVALNRDDLKDEFLKYLKERISAE